MAVSLLLSGLVIDLHNRDDYPINAKTQQSCHCGQRSREAPKGWGWREKVTPWIESRAWDKSLVPRHIFLLLHGSGRWEESLGNAQELGKQLSSLTPLNGATFLSLS